VHAHANDAAAFRVPEIREYDLLAQHGYALDPHTYEFLAQHDWVPEIRQYDLLARLDCMP